MQTVSGYIEKIIYRNENNGYTVLSVEGDDDDYVFVGTFNYIAEGQRTSVLWGCGPATSLEL